MASIAHGVTTPDLAEMVRPLKSISGVAGIYVCPGEVVSVYTIIDGDDEPTYDQVYQGERRVMHAFPMLHFDFNVVARRGRPISEIVGSIVPAWQKDDALVTCQDAINI